jgi:hypothetical protein
MSPQIAALAGQMARQNRAKASGGSGADCSVSGSGSEPPQCGGC